MKFALKPTKTWLPLAAALLVFGGGLFAVLATPKKTAPLAPAASGNMTWGMASAPNTLVIFSDFESLYSAALFGAENDVAKKLHNEDPGWVPLVPELAGSVSAGKVRVVFRDFAYLSPESAKAAAAARCLSDSLGGADSYPHAALAVFGLDDSAGRIDPDHLPSLADSLPKKSRPDFLTCLDSKKHADEVATDTADGELLEVAGTPAVFVNGKLIRGAQSASLFLKMIAEKEQTKN